MEFLNNLSRSQDSHLLKHVHNYRLVMSIACAFEMRFTNKEYLEYKTTTLQGWIH